MLKLFIYITVFTKYQSRINLNAEVGTVIASSQVRKWRSRGCLINVPKSIAVSGGVGTPISVGCSIDFSAETALDGLTKKT